MNKRYGKIIGVGKYVPEKVLTNGDLEKMVDTSDAWIVERSGIRERHIVSDQETTSTIATKAAEAALANAGMKATDLDLIIIASSSPDYLTPPVSSQVQHALGAEKVGAMTLVTGCTGFLYALVTAQQFLSAGVYKNILVVGAEVISRFINWKDRSTCVLFGDGAGAFVLQATEEPSGVLSFVLGSDGSGQEHLIMRGGGTANPPSLQSVQNGQHYVEMNGPEVFKFATRTMGKVVLEAIREANLCTEDIDLFIPHQANIRIIDSAARYIGLPREKIFVNIQKYGNTSAASIPIAFCEALEQGCIQPGNLVAMVAFGAGLTWASAVLKFN